MEKSQEFITFQRKFYKSRDWYKVRNYIRYTRDKGVCQMCHQLIISKKWIVDHRIEINSKNMNDKDITLNPDNLQLLCITCHNKKTFTKKALLREFNYKKRDRRWIDG